MNPALLTAIIAVAAVISPVITTLMNNAHERKMKKLENQQKLYETDYLHRRETFENYLVALANRIHVNNGTKQQEYLDCYLKALLYAPTHIQAQMEDVHRTLLKNGLPATGYPQNDLANSLSQELERRLSAISQPPRKTGTIFSRKKSNP